MKRIGILLFVLIFLIVLPIHVWAATDSDECPHIAWEDGVCTECHLRCEHPSYDNGICAICGMNCDHVPHTEIACEICGKKHEDWHTRYEDGICTKCGYICNHPGYENGECVECGMSCSHDWINGQCSICNMECSHFWSDGYCVFCQMECTHEWNAEQICGWTVSWCNKCHMGCSHENYHEGQCELCGHWVTHQWENGICLNCRTVCKHTTWENGACYSCGMPCAHQFDDGICTRCGLYCSHELTSETREEEGTLQYADDGFHTYYINVYKRDYCQICGKQYGAEYWYNREYGNSEAHTFIDGVCQKCGYPDPAQSCTHHWVSTISEKKSILENDDVQHIYEKIVVENRHCSLCGEKRKFENLAATIYGPHEYDENGLCSVCGFNKVTFTSCEHKNCTSPEEEIDSSQWNARYVYLSAMYHQFAGIGVGKKVCKDCGTEWLVNISGDSGYAEHIFEQIDGKKVCIYCGYQVGKIPTEPTATPTIDPPTEPTAAPTIDPTAEPDEMPTIEDIPLTTLQPKTSAEKTLPEKESSDKIIQSIVMEDSVHVRSQPNTHCAVNGVLMADHVVCLESVSLEDDGYIWIKISNARVEGYIRGDLLRFRNAYIDGLANLMTVDELAVINRLSIHDQFTILFAISNPTYRNAIYLSENTAHLITSLEERFNAMDSDEMEKNNRFMESMKRKLFIADDIHECIVISLVIGEQDTVSTYYAVWDNPFSEKLIVSEMDNLAEAT